MENVIGLLACLLVAATSKSGRIFAAFLLAYHCAYMISMAIQGSMFDPIGEVVRLEAYQHIYPLSFAIIDLVFLAILVALSISGKLINRVLAIGYGAAILSKILIGGVVAIHQSAESSSMIELHALRQAAALYIDIAFLLIGTKSGVEFARVVIDVLLYRGRGWCNIVRITSADSRAGKGRNK